MDKKAALLLLENTALNGLNHTQFNYLTETCYERNQIHITLWFKHLLHTCSPRGELTLINVSVNARPTELNVFSDSQSSFFIHFFQMKKIKIKILRGSQGYILVGKKM